MILLLTLVVSCSKPEPVASELMQIDSLLQHDPDSALLLLLGMDKACLVSSTANACVGALLLSEALYKTNNPQLNRYRNETFQETSLQDAMRYFDSLAFRYPDNDDITMLSARAHYMNGVGFYENDSVVEACKEYLHTLEIMEEHFDVENLTGYKAKFMALTYGRLGDLFSDQFMVASAIDCGKNHCFTAELNQHQSMV